MADVDTQRSIGASIDGDAPRRTPAWLLTDAVAKRNTGRRGRSRKRRPNRAERAARRRRAPTPVAAPVTCAPRARSASLKAAGERPQAPWHPLPLSELLILVGAIGAVVAWLRGVAEQRRAARARRSARS